MVEHVGILTQTQGGFRQNKSTDINDCKLYGLTKEAQRRKQRFLSVDIDFKSAFNSMSQSSLWAILEVYNIPDMDLLKSLYEHTTVRLTRTWEAQRSRSIRVWHKELSSLHSSSPSSSIRSHAIWMTLARRNTSAMECKESFPLTTSCLLTTCPYWLKIVTTCNAC